MRKTNGWIIAAVFFVGCADISSTDVRTSGIYADIRVDSTGDGTSQVVAVLKAGGARSNTYLMLEGEDTLSAEFEGDVRTLTRDSLGDYHRYVTTFESEVADLPYTIAFSRADDDSAPETVVALPEPFSITEQEGSFSRTDNITIEWGPTSSSDNLRITASGTCILTYTRDVSGDPGSYTIEAGTLESVDPDAMESCDVAYTLDRWRAGTLDGAYGEGGEAAGHQIRTIDVLTQP